MLRFLHAREDQIETLIRNYGPYVNILGNIIGTGPWFDAYVPNILGVFAGEFAPGPLPMTSWSRRTQLLAAAIPVALLLLAFLVFPGDGSRTVTAHFDRAVAVYPGTDLRVMGVQIGEVTAVVPDGNSVRVEMVYDEEYKLPADAKAAVVTPTLVADRYVQVFPAYGKGAVMPDGGGHPALAARRRRSSSTGCSRPWTTSR